MQRFYHSNIFMLILLCLSLYTPSYAHNFSELGYQLPTEQQAEVLNILQTIIDHVEEPEPPKTKPDSLDEATLLRAKLYEAEGKTLLMELLDKSTLKAAFEPAPFAVYIEHVSALLYDYEHSQNNHHKLDKTIIKQLKTIQQEVEAWLP